MHSGDNYYTHSLRITSGFVIFYGLPATMAAKNIEKRFLLHKQHSPGLKLIL